MTPWHALLTLFCLLSVLVAGCSTGPSAAECWPTDDWRTSTPEEQGMDLEVLAGLDGSLSLYL